MIFTSFLKLTGDISASTQGERVEFFLKEYDTEYDDFCVQVYMIFLFLTTVSLFGSIISQLNEILSTYAGRTKDLEDTLELYLRIRPRYKVIGRVSSIILCLK
jgi:hypothetical protein